MRRFASIPYEFEPEIRLEAYDPLQYGYDPTLTRLMTRRSYVEEPEYITPEEGGPVERRVDPYDPYAPLPDDAPACDCPPARSRTPWLMFALVAASGYILGRR